MLCTLFERKKATTKNPEWMKSKLVFTPLFLNKIHARFCTLCFSQFHSLSTIPHTSQCSIRMYASIPYYTHGSFSLAVEWIKNMYGMQLSDYASRQYSFDAQPLYFPHTNDQRLKLPVNNDEKTAQCSLWLYAVFRSSASLPHPLFIHLSRFIWWWKCYSIPLLMSNLY